MQLKNIFIFKKMKHKKFKWKTQFIYLSSQKAKHKKMKKKLENTKFFYKIAKICDIKKLKINPWPIKIWQTLTEVLWPLRLKKVV